jgi:hypothetical protein
VSRKPIAGPGGGEVDAIRDAVTRLARSTARAQDDVKDQQAIEPDAAPPPEPLSKKGPDPERLAAYRHTAYMNRKARLQAQKEESNKKEVE